MTLSKKYNEIMSKVVVTDEMRRRVLKEISSADPEKLSAYKIDEDDDFAGVFSNRKKFPAAKILAGLALACAIILIAGVIRISRPLMSGSSMASDVEYEEAAEFAAEDTEADAIVGNQDTGGQPALQSAENADEGPINETVGGETAGAIPKTAGGGNAGALEEAADNGTAGAVTNGAADEEAAGDVTSDRAGMPVQLGEPEIRKVVEEYIGPEFKITDTASDESTLIYTVADSQSKEIFSYIRIDASDGRVEIENVQTREISTLTFREMQDVN